MDTKIKTKVLNIMTLILDVNSHTKNSCYVKFKGQSEDTPLIISINERGESEPNNVDFQNIVWLNPNTDNYDKEVSLEELDEIIDYLEKLKNANVLIVGVGGVGSFAAEFIARAGVGKITIVDGDVVDITNINRQLPALHSTVGAPKIDVVGFRTGPYLL